MSSLENEIFSYNYESVQYDNAPPAYTASTATPLCNINNGPSTGQPWDEFPPPPAYDTLPDLPIWSVSLSASQSDTSSNFQQWNILSEIPAYSVTSPAPQMTATSAFNHKFRRRRQGVLGVLEILAAFIQVGTGTVLASNELGVFTNSLLYAIPFWAPVCYLIAGCLSSLAIVKPSYHQVRCSLFFNIITIIISCVGLTFNVNDIQNLCKVDGSAECYRSSKAAYEIIYVLISTNAVLLCTAISAVIIGFYVLCCVSREDTQPSVIENNFVTSMPLPDCPQTPPLPPPPYTPQGAFKRTTTQQNTYKITVM